MSVPPESATAQALQNISSQATEPAHDATEPVNEWDSLLAQLATTPYEPEKWYRLVELAEGSGELPKIQAAYDGMLAAYPNTPAAQIAYINHFLRTPATYKTAEELFKKFLRASSFVDLWKHYITYIRKLHNTAAGREIVRQSYDYALVHCGHDKDSRGLWDEYIAFMKEPVASHTPEGQQKTGKQIEEEQHQRNLLIRKVYQRAVQIPFRDVEEVWSDYEAFENKLDKTLAKGLMSKCMPSYMQARQVYRNLRTMTPPLYPPVTTSASVPGLFLPAPPTFSAGDRALVAAWKAYLKWEESNPLELEDKDKATLNHRLTGAYRAALVRMRFFSEIWYMAYQWHRSIGKDTEAEALLKTGLEANPTSFVLNFAQAEVLETKNSLAEAHELYSTFLRKLESELEDVEARTSSANSSIMSDPNVTANDSMLSLNPNLSQVSSQGSQGPPVVEDKKGKELKDRKAEYGVVWVKYMRFARRAEGLQAARDVFKKARQSKWTPWEVYDASAMIEYHCTKRPDISMKIYDMGMKAFADDPSFALKYLSFLLSINDEPNARALFETFVTGPQALPPARARTFWERWARYIYEYSDLATARDMERRFAETFPNDPPIKRFAQRHSYMNTDAIAARDLGFGFRQSAPPGLAPSRSETANSIANTSGNSLNADRKRGPSPDRDRRREDDRKRARGSPSRDRERDRDRRDTSIRRPRYGSPPTGWDRDRDGPGAMRKDIPREREEPPQKQVIIPAVLAQFIGMLPPKEQFDGPMFRPDEIMSVFRNAVIPASSQVRTESPVPPRGGRPPPDYGPYSGAGGGRGRRW